MKKTKRILTTLLAVIMLLGVVVIAAEAASLSTTKTNYGYMITTDAKISKAASTVKVYGNYDYINFYINSNYGDMYFFYEIYSDKKMTKMVASDYTYCESSGAYSWSPKIKLKGTLNSGTYYGVTYAAKIDGSGNAKISEPSLQQFKLSVNRKPEFKQQMVILKSVSNTVNGPVVKWSKLSSEVTKYVIYRRSITGTKWTRAGAVNGSTFSFTDKSLKNKNGKYVYTVRAYNKSGTASKYLYNGLVCLFAKAPKISSVSTVSDNRIQVKWNKTADSAYYKVYRSENGGKWKTINSKFKGTTYYDTTAKNGKNYKYTVKAIIRTSYGNAVSAYHNVNKKVDFLSAPKLNPVTVVENGLSITWEKVEGTENYTVFRKTLENGAKWVNLGKVSADVTEYVDTTANEESSFIYTVRADGEKSKGSYSNKGVEIVNLTQPEMSVTISSREVTLNWNAVVGATNYNILEKKENGSWVLLKETSNTSFTFTPSGYYNRTLTVQATRGEYKSTFNVNVQPIVFYPENTLSMANFKDYIKMSWENTGADSYNLYRKLKTENDSSYQLIYSGTKNSFKDTTAEYDVLYTYVVKGVWNSQEQKNNFAPKDRVKYSTEKYISDFSVVLHKSDHDYSDDDFYDDDYESAMDGEIDPRWYYYNIKTKPESENLKGRVYYKTNNGWKSVSSTNIGFTDTPPEFSYIVYDANGSTPIDAFSSVPVNDFCPFPKFTINAINGGIRVNWDEVEGAVKYEVTARDTDINKKAPQKDVTVNATGSKKYSVDFTGFEYSQNSLYGLVSVRAINSYGNQTSFYKKFKVFDTPKLEKIFVQPGEINLLWDSIFIASYDMDYEYVVFRKAEGEKNWKKLTNGNLQVGLVEINGVEYDYSGCYTDTTAKKGVKYTYTVRIYDPVSKQYVSGYNQKGLTAVAK